MGRRLRWAFYTLRMLVFYAVLLVVLWQAYRLAEQHVLPTPDPGLSQAIQSSFTEVSAESVRRFLAVPGVQTLIFVYDSNTLLTRWYFNDFNALAGRYAPLGVRILFLAADEDRVALANYLASRKEPLAFTPLVVNPQELLLIQGLMKELGADTFYDTVPYMAVINKSLFLRDLSPTSFRPGKLGDILDIGL